jgi:hypothetical protein
MSGSLGQHFLHAFWANDERSVEGEGRQGWHKLTPSPQATITIENVHHARSSI